MDIIAGRNPVKEALAARTPSDFEKILVASSSGAKKGGNNPINPIISDARGKGIDVEFVHIDELTRMSSDIPHQGIIAIVKEYKYAELSDIFDKAAESGEPPFIIIADGIEDPHNLGAIIRSAETAGAHGIIIPKRRAVGITATVAKGAAGATEYLPCMRVSNISNTIEILKEKGLWIAACDMGGTIYHEQDLTGPIALVVGSEGKGVSRLVREKCDFIVSIPLCGKVNSLNASNAAAIISHEVRRQRSNTKNV